MQPQTPAPRAIDPTKINHRAVRLVEAFKDAITRLHVEHGLTFDDITLVTDFLLHVREEAGGVTPAMVAQPLFGDAFQGGGSGYTLSEEISAPTYVPDSPLIGNPGLCAATTKSPTSL